MNFYTLAKKMRKEISRRADDIKHIKNDNIFEDDNDRYEQAKLEAIKDFDVTTRLGIELMLKYREIAEDMGLTEKKVDTKTFMITVRPENNKIKFHQFYNLVAGFVQRACFIEYSLSFEQKGITEETLGNGYHVHIIANMKQRSKGEVLRDTISTFSNCTAAHCIQVDICKNANETIQNYLIDYKSKDDHKEVTHEWDNKWRTKLNLLNLYKNNLHKWDTEERAYQVRSGTTIIEIA